LHVSPQPGILKTINTLGSFQVFLNSFLNKLSLFAELAKKIAAGMGMAFLAGQKSEWFFWVIGVRFLKVN
jgi:hypothetical protein